MHSSTPQSWSPSWHSFISGRIQWVDYSITHIQSSSSCTLEKFYITTDTKINKLLTDIFHNKKNANKYSTPVHSSPPKPVGHLHEMDSDMLHETLVKHVESKNGCTFNIITYLVRIG